MLKVPVSQNLALAGADHQAPSRKMGDKKGSRLQPHRGGQKEGDRPGRERQEKDNS